MRIASLVLCVLGAFAAAFLGFKWLSDASANQEMIDQLRAMGAPTGELDRVVYAAYGLFAAAAVGLASLVLVLKDRGKLAAALLVVAVAVPAALAPRSLVFSFPLLIAAGFALAARPTSPRRSSYGTAGAASLG